MKVHEILPETLEERALRHAVAAGIVGASLAAAPNKMADHSPPPTRPMISQDDQGPPEPSEEEIRQRQMRTRVADRIAQQYRVNKELAAEVVELAHKYEDPEFPTARDILAVVGVESSFQPDSVSRLKRDPARGLMQVRPGVWGIDPKELEDIETQIRVGAEILKRYYTKLGDPEAALQAYNVGLSKYRQGQTNPRYISKYQDTLARLSDDI